MYKCEICESYYDKYANNFQKNDIQDNVEIFVCSKCLLIKEQEISNLINEMQFKRYDNLRFKETTKKIVLYDLYKAIESILLTAKNMLGELQ